MADDFQLDGDELAELREFFFVQATEVIDSLGGLILKVERDPSDAETLRAIRRAVHTLKGDSTAFGFSELTELAHRYEDALDRIRERQGTATRELIDLLLAGSDALAAYISYYQGLGDQPEVAQLFAGLAALHEPAPATTAVENKIASPQPDSEIKAEPVEPEAEKTKKSRSKKSGLSIVAPADEKPAAPETAAAPEPATAAVIQLPQPTAIAAPEPATEHAAETAPEQHGEIVEDFRLVGERRQGEDRRQGDRRQSHTAASTLRVESERIDAAMNLVGELIIQRSMIATLSGEIEQLDRKNELYRRLSESVSMTGRILSELQESVMRMRLVAIDQVFKRFPRVVRDASIKLGKPLRLEMSGGDTEIDKSVVEVISDPLIHLIRNACDHGIEPPEVRRAAGKPAEGIIRLSARRAGNQIAVEVSDNGGGIDASRIVRKAIEKGLVTAYETSDWTDSQKIGLIFLPGFSTKDAVSDMSGRGVGMDVVKTTVDSLGGSINVHSVMGEGSRFIIRLPLTMAIVRAMLFESCGRSFALPLDSIRRITRLRPGETRTIDGREVLRLHEQVIPLLRVDEALKLRTPAERDLNMKYFVFIVELGDGRSVGLVVEKLFGEQELVLKTVDDKLTQSPLVAGASILGDGNVVLILDAPAMIDFAVAQERRRATTNR
ncbi:MAG: chemotaxis protein CheA [Blastocatellia bacterium]